MSLFTYTPHPQRARRRHRDPARVNDQYDTSTAYARCNARLAVKITGFVGSMTCAYLFGAIALVGLPGAIHQGVLGIVQWIAQTFLQLVLLSIILVGQSVQASAADKRALDTFNDAEALLHESLQLQAHLFAQDELIAKLAKDT